MRLAGVRGVSRRKHDRPAMPVLVEMQRRSCDVRVRRPRTVHGTRDTPRLATTGTVWKGDREWFIRLVVPVSWVIYDRGSNRRPKHRLVCKHCGRIFHCGHR